MAVTVITAIFLILLYAVIFRFSSQNGTESTELSQGITKEYVSTFSWLFKLFPEEYQGDLEAVLEPVIRKMGHVSEYAAMGMLVYVLLSQWIIKRKIPFTLLWVAISAAGDEFHQTFVPGRSGNVVDVFIDTGGGMLGIIICIVILKMYLMMRKHREKR